MPSLRDLKNRLRSVSMTGKLAGAMRIVAAAKYQKVSSLSSAGEPYANACEELYELVLKAEQAAKREKGGRDAFDDGLGPREGKPPMYVLVSGNRGLCGGYNHELFAFFGENIASKGDDYLLVICGRMAKEYCAEKGIAYIKEFEITDVPSHGEAAALFDYLSDAYENNKVSSVSFVCQHFHNMLKQTPEIKSFLPTGENEDNNKNGANSGEVLFVPDAATVKKQLEGFCRTAKLHSLLLSCASGAQAATLMAMRAAYDNAKSQAASLETVINRRRQAEVTQSVIETAADNSEY